MGSVLIAQDFLPEHWNWANTDLVTLGDIEKMGNVIKTRLENSGCKISEMYAVKHDKDESKLWNEYTMTYDVKFTTNHAYFLIKFSEGKTLEEIEYYRERYEAWTRGRAERKMNDTKNTLNFLKVGIAKGEINLEDIILT